MSIFGGFVKMITGGLISDVGDAIAKNVTSDEERLALRNDLAEIARKSEERGLEYAEIVEQNITARHNADMNSDSKLAKNIRPYTLIVLTTFTLLYMLVPVFKELNEYSAKAYDATLAALIGLDMMIYGFYFGSRGLEIVAGKIADALKKGS